MNYRQSKLPISQEMKDFILHNIDIDKDITLAKATGIRRESIVTMKIAYVVLCSAVYTNKSFYDIGKFMCSKELHSLCQKYQLSSNDINQLLEDVSHLASSSFQ